MLALRCVDDTRRADGLLNQRDHFGGTIYARHVLHDLALLDDQAVEQGGQQLPARIRIAALPELPDALRLNGSHVHGGAATLIAQLFQPPSFAQVSPDTAACVPDR